MPQAEDPQVVKVRHKRRTLAKFTALCQMFADKMTAIGLQMPEARQEWLDISLKMQGEPAKNYRFDLLTGQLELQKLQAAQKAHKNATKPLEMPNPPN